MLLSFIFLKTRFRFIHYLGVALCLSGLALLVTTDAIYNNHQGNFLCSFLFLPLSHSFLVSFSSEILLLTYSNLEGEDTLKGDLLCLAGAFLYAISNVGQEGMVKKFDRVEYLGMLGFFGTIISILQLYVASIPYPIIMK